MTNKIKQTGEAAIAEQFKPKKQDIDIYYQERNSNNELIGERTLTYLDIKGYSLNGPYLIIQLHNDTQFVYPMSAISSLKLSVSE